ncbi:hypothetical protein Tco_0021243, partial [Tanacetum coccineum]
ITKLSVSGLIVAHPHYRGKQNPTVNMDVNKFVYDLTKTNILEGVKYAFWEEGFASEHAACVMHPFKFDAKKEQQVIHKLAATGIFDIPIFVPWHAYLDAVNRAKRDWETSEFESD